MGHFFLFYFILQPVSKLQCFVVLWNGYNGAAENKISYNHFDKYGKMHL